MLDVCVYVCEHGVNVRVGSAWGVRDHAGNGWEQEWRDVVDGEVYSCMMVIDVPVDNVSCRCCLRRRAFVRS